MKKVKRLAVMFVALCMVLALVMPAYAVESFEVQAVSTINAKTIEVQFNADVDQTLAVNAGNYAVRERYGAQTMLPVASASMKLDASGNVIGNTVVLKFASATKPSTLYYVTVSNVTAFDGTLLTVGKNSWTFVGTSLNTPEDQDIVLQSSKVSGLTANGSGIVDVTWTAFDAYQVNQTGVIGYEVYYMKKVDLGSALLTKDTLGAVKVAVDGVSTSSVQLNLEVSSEDYMFVIYAVNGRTYSMRATLSELEPKVESIAAINNTTVSVTFNMEVDISEMTFKISEKYGAKALLPVIGVSLSSDGKTVILTTASQKASTLYGIEGKNVKSTAGNYGDNFSMIFVGIG